MSFTYILERTPLSAVTEVENFTVDTSGGASVPIVTGTDFNTYNLGGPNRIPIDAGILLESVYVRLPYQFTLGDVALGISFNGNDSVIPGGEEFDIPELLDGSPFMLPIENTEIPLNIFIPAVAKLGRLNAWILQARIFIDGVFYAPPNVSMLGVPAAMDATVNPVIVGVRVSSALAFT